MASHRPTRVTNRIKELRAGTLTQAELADAVGVTRQTIIAIEAGRYSPSLEVAFLIAAALGHRLEDVFSHPAAPRLGPPAGQSEATPSPTTSR